MMKLTRKQIEEGLNTIPMETVLLGTTTAKGKRLTASQIKFAEEIALGKTKAEAYRQSRPNGRKSNANPRTASRNGQKLAKDDAIQTQIEAFRVALEAQKYQTPAHLRALAIHKITEKALSEDTPPAQQLKALELLGKITEVALFTERREIVQTTNSADMRAKLLNSIRLAISSQGAETIEADQADELLAELTGIQPDDDQNLEHERQTMNIDTEDSSDNQEQSSSVLDLEANQPPDPSQNQKAATPPEPQPQKSTFTTAGPLHSIPHNGSVSDTVSPPVTEGSVTPVTPENVEKSTPCVSSSINPMLSKGEG